MSNVKKTAKNKSKYLNLTDETSVPRVAITETVKDILKIAEQELGKKKSDMVILDIGSGFGMYTKEFAWQVKGIVAVEPFKDAHEKAIKLNKHKNVKHVNSLIENYKGSEKFDVAVSLTTLEHMPNQYKSYKQVFNMMKNKSLLYVTAPNKLWPVEPHYALPFLSWLPLPFANLYLKITGKGGSYKDSSYSKTYSGMKKLFDRFGHRYWFVIPDTNAVYLGCGSKSLKNTVLRHGGVWLIRKFPLFWTFSKGFILVAKKEN